MCETALTQKLLIHLTLLLTLIEIAEEKLTASDNIVCAVGIVVVLLLTVVDHGRDVRVAVLNEFRG